MGKSFVLCLENSDGVRVMFSSPGRVKALDSEHDSAPRDWPLSLSVTHSRSRVSEKKWPGRAVYSLHRPSSEPARRRGSSSKHYSRPNPHLAVSVGVIPSDVPRFEAAVTPSRGGRRRGDCGGGGGEGRTVAMHRNTTSPRQLAPLSFAPRTRASSVVCIEQAGGERMTGQPHADTHIS